MANIMITYRCNLHCPYCFANEYVNKSYTDITKDNFVKAVEFITQNGSTSIGLIGGEPTIHPMFDQYIQMLSWNPKVSSIILYTNGLLLHEHKSLFMDPLVRSKLKILVNCNSPDQIGQNNMERLVQNLDMLFGECRMGANVKLGVNLYHNDFDYSFIKDLLRRYSLCQIRISLTVPDFKKNVCQNAFDNFEDRKDYLMKFYHDMDEIGVLAYYDCNLPPSCIWTDEEWIWINQYRNRYRNLQTNITNTVSTCKPIIDILPNLLAVRCFGMSNLDKFDINKYNDINELKGEFLKKYDEKACLIPADNDCLGCADYKKCMGGCIGYKYHLM